jgi:hypothetical protein
MSTESDDEGNIISLSLQISKGQLGRKKALLNRAKEGLIATWLPRYLEWPMSNKNLFNYIVYNICV